jgi:methionyl-tRNA formyltransferase
MRIVFFGSPDFALPSLEALVAAGHEVALAVSQPAKPVGRSGAPPTRPSRGAPASSGSPSSSRRR